MAGMQGRAKQNYFLLFLLFIIIWLSTHKNYCFCSSAVAISNPAGKIGEVISYHPYLVLLVYLTWNTLSSPFSWSCSQISMMSCCVKSKISQACCFLTTICASQVVLTEQTILGTVGLGLQTEYWLCHL